MTDSFIFSAECRVQGAGWYQLPHGIVPDSVLLDH